MKKLIGVLTEPDRPVDQMVWAALEALAPVRFCFDQSRFGTVDAAIVFSSDQTSWARVPGAPRKRLAVLTPDPSRSPDSPHVIFGTTSRLDSRLRTRRLRHTALQVHRACVSTTRDDVLATVDEIPCWFARATEHGDVQFVTVGSPQNATNELPFHSLNGDSFMPLLPILHFIREVAGNDAWSGPAPRACVMFDDPNLHWPSYGFLSYRKLAAAAREEPFHAAMATIPLDGWFVHDATAQIFRENPRELSLLMHGNDHVQQELGNVTDEQRATAVLTQALCRTAEIEKRAGVRVARVMAPPHGACRPFMTGIMSRLGYQAACISPWSLMDWSAGREWNPSFGLCPTELMEEGFPVAPRFRLSQACEGWVVINAFLDRPIVAVGHHESARDGLDTITRVAQYVNRIPGVQWSNMDKVIKTCFLTRTRGDRLHIRPFASRIAVPVPPAVHSVVIEDEDVSVRSLWCNTGDARHANGSEWAVTPGSIIEFQRSSHVTAPHVSYTRSLWAPVRRVLCETRDRMQPFLRRRVNIAPGVVESKSR